MSFFFGVFSSRQLRTIFVCGFGHPFGATFFISIVALRCPTQTSYQNHPLWIFQHKSHSHPHRDSRRPKVLWSWQTDLLLTLDKHLKNNATKQTPPNITFKYSQNNERDNYLYTKHFLKLDYACHYHAGVKSCGLSGGNIWERLPPIFHETKVILFCGCYNETGLLFANSKAQKTKITIQMCHTERCQICFCATISKWMAVKDPQPRHLKSVTIHSLWGQKPMILLVALWDGQVAAKCRDNQKWPTAWLASQCNNPKKILGINISFSLWLWGLHLKNGTTLWTSQACNQNQPCVEKKTMIKHYHPILAQVFALPLCWIRIRHPPLVVWMRTTNLG